MGEKVFIAVYNVEREVVEYFFFPKNKFFSYGESDKTFSDFVAAGEKIFLPIKSMGKKKRILTVYCSPVVEAYFKKFFSSYLYSLKKKGESYLKTYGDKPPVFGNGYTRRDLAIFYDFWNKREQFLKQEKKEMNIFLK